MTIWVIVDYDGVYGAYSEYETAVYAYATAPGTCQPPQKVEVFIS